MRYLIIGITSLFGPVVASKIKEHDPECQILGTGRTSARKAKAGDAEFRELNILDKESIINLLMEFRPDYIYNFAVQNSVGYAWEDPQYTIEVNVNGTLNILDAVRELDYKPRVIIAGSGEEYGELPFSEMPIDEDVKVNPRNIFAASKACQTMMSELYVKAYDMDIVVLRTFNEIGEGQNDRFAVSNFCHQFAKIEKGLQKPEIVIGNINICRDFTDVRDLAEAFVLVALKGKKGQVYNAGRGASVPIRYVLDELMKITGVEVKLVADAARIRPIDSPVFESDNTKIYKDTGWQSSISIDDTICDILNYWRKVEDAK